MPAPSDSFRRLRWGTAAGIGFLLLSVVVVILGGRAAEGRSAALQTAASVEDGDGEGRVEGPTTTTSPSTPSTTAPPTTTTAPAPKPVPVPVPVPVPTTVRVVRTTVPAPIPAAVPTPPSPPAVAAPGPSSSASAERCAAARQWVEAHGLVLPAGYGFRCPGPALQGETPRWGITCWNCAGAGSYIAVDIDRIGSSDAALRYVVAHETCHAIDFATLGVSTEIGADLCAALHGAPRP